LGAACVIDGAIAPAGGDTLLGFGLLVSHPALKRIAANMGAAKKCRLKIMRTVFVFNHSPRIVIVILSADELVILSAAKEPYLSARFFIPSAAHFQFTAPSGRNIYSNPAQQTPSTSGATRFRRNPESVSNEILSEKRSHCNPLETAQQIRFLLSLCPFVPFVYQDFGSKSATIRANPRLRFPQRLLQIRNQVPAAFDAH
jgi:hypothetical protein